MVIKVTRWQMFLSLVPIPLQNKFILVSILFTVWMCFIDDNSLVNLYSREVTLRNIKAIHKHYTDEIAECDLYEGIRLGDEKAIERIAREKYFMKRKDEEVFIIITDEMIENSNTENAKRDNIGKTK
jgi:cell division protein DivIC